MPTLGAITLSLFILMVVFSLASWLVFSQLGIIADDWPLIKEKSTSKLNHLVEWANEHLYLDYDDYISDNDRLIIKAEKVPTVFASSISNLLAQSFIIFVYVVLLLMQKQMFIRFFEKLSKNKSAMGSILKNSAQIVKKYLLGKSKIMILFFIIYFIGFKLGGLPYAIFLALFAALFSIVP